jgi:hypothetical protein
LQYLKKRPTLKSLHQIMKRDLSGSLIVLLNCIPFHQTTNIKDLHTHVFPLPVFEISILFYENGQISLFVILLITLHNNKNKNMFRELFPLGYKYAC